MGNHFLSLELYQQRVSELLLQGTLAVNKLHPWRTAMHAMQHPLAVQQKICFSELLPFKNIAYF